MSMIYVYVHHATIGVKMKSILLTIYLNIKRETEREMRMQIYKDISVCLSFDYSEFHRG